MDAYYRRISCFFYLDFAARVFKSYLIDAAGRKADNEISNHLYRHLVLLRMKNKPHSAGAFAKLLQRI